jgi:hypothetical protein
VKIDRLPQGMIEIQGEISGKISVVDLHRL